MHPSLFAMLEELHIRADYLPKLTRAEILPILGNYEGVFVRSKTKIDAEFLANAPKLRFIGRAGSGMDLIDLDITKKRNIYVFNAPEGNRDAVAEQTLGLLLALLRNIPQGDRQIRAKQWLREANRGTEIRGKTLAIIGYGNIGQTLARLLSGFACKVLVYDKYDNGFATQYAQEATMEQIFAEADIVTLHIPLTEETRNMVNAEYLQRFSKNIILLNTARGEIVSLPDLQAALESGKVLGAGLDVLENEKIDALTPTQQATFDYLIQSDRVILSPHVAGWTYESYIRINEVLVDKLQDFLVQNEV
ncbi:MAG: NAD(P)-binding domain-containing protein [Microscillaceae bacterium]|nr:NAD(P)-binding domain-containing protein [Microscillaceae bacterium]